mgnify:CR=1 FL=1
MLIHALKQAKKGCLYYKLSILTIKYADFVLDTVKHYCYIANVAEILLIYVPCKDLSKQLWSRRKLKLKKGVVMKHSFYDVKAKKKVEAEVTEKVTYGKKGNERYAFKAKTSDGRNLTAFVSKDVWTKAKV